jgi:hypothetical protein
MVVDSEGIDIIRRVWLRERCLRSGTVFVVIISLCVIAIALKVFICKQ